MKHVNEHIEIRTATLAKVWLVLPWLQQYDDEGYSALDASLQMNVYAGSVY
jgi:hypothetical protein